MSSNGALMLLSGEPQGFAIDATTEGGSIAIRDTTTKANNHIISGVTDSIRNGLDSFNRTRAGSAKLVQSGTSAKMVHFPTSPYVRWSPHNLCDRSQEFSNAYWTDDGSGVLTVTADQATAPDGTVTAEKLTAGNNSGFHGRYSTNETTVASAYYTVSCYVKAVASERYISLIGVAGGTDWYAADFDLNSPSAPTQTAAGAGATVVGGTITSVGSGWYRLTVTGQYASAVTRIAISAVNSATPTHGSFGNVTWTPAASEAFYVWGAQTNRGVVATPYIPTTSAAVIGIPQAYDATEELYGILAEPAGTNLETQSDTAGPNSTYSFNTVITLDTTTAPDGSTTADKMADSTANAEHVQLARNGQNVADGTIMTHSVYLKAAGRNYAAVQVADNSATRKRTTILVDLTDGSILTTRSIGSPTSQASSVVSVGDGWYRCSVTQAMTVGSDATFAIYTSNSSSPSYSASDGPTYAGDNTSGIYMWGRQFETGPVATSYIPTVGSTVTRAVDSVHSTATIPVSSTTYSVMAWAKQLKHVNAGSLVGHSNGTATHDAALFPNSTTAINIYSSGDVNANAGAYTIGTAFKAAGRWLLNDTRGAVNGTLGTQDTSTTPDTGVTMALVGCSGDLNSSECVMIYQGIWLPRAYSDTELQAKTTL